MEKLSYRVGDRLVDLRSARVVAGDACTELSPIEVKLLAYLAERPGEVVGRDELLQEVWGYRAGIRTRTIDNTVHRLRSKLEPDPTEPRHLHVVYGQGLRLDGVVPAVEPGRSDGFVGREQELAELRAMIDRGARLVTVVGPAGVGKTRLARELLAGLGRRALFAEVGAQDPDTAVAQALGVAGGGSADLLAATGLAARGPTVLILDECESQVAAVADRVSRWGTVQVVVTSRRPLDHPDELRFAVGPLAEDEAVALFVARARARDPGFAVDPERLRPFARAVDGLPLAIELGAARVHLVGAEALANLGARGMDAALGPSLAALDLRDRDLLTALAVLESPFTLEDSAAVGDLPVGTAVDRLAALAEHGLLKVDPPRYALYAIVRETVREEGHPAELRHARWFARLGTYEHNHRVRSDASLREELRASIADLRAAYRRSLPVEPELAARCAVALVGHYAREGPSALALPLLAELADLPCSARTRATLAIAESTALVLQSDPHSALAAINVGLEVAAEPDLIVELRSTRAMALVDHQGPDAARAELELATPLLARSGRAAVSYHNAAGSFAEDYRTAQEAILASARAARRYGDGVSEARALAIAGHNAVWQGEWAVGQRYLQRALDRVATLGVPTRTRGLALQQLGRLERNRGRSDRAEELLTEALVHQERLGDRGGAALTRVELGLVEVQRGEPDGAMALLDQALLDAGDRPSHLALSAWTAIAEAELSRNATAAARAALTEALGHSRGPSSRVSVLELEAVALALDDEGPEALDALARSDLHPRPGGAHVQHLACAALVEALVGSADAAEARLSDARERVQPLEPTAGSHLVQWIGRAELAIEVARGREARKVLPMRWRRS